MKIIERYLSAYVVDCLFGHGKDNVHMDYVYQVLRETGSKTNHPVLSKILDYIRQGDPKDPAIQAEVRAYVLETAKAGAWTEVAPKSKYQATFQIKDGFAFFVVSSGTSLVAVGYSKQDQISDAIQELKSVFPDIVITQK